MKWRLWTVVALVVASCAAPEAPEAWDIQRIAPADDELTSDPTVCDDVRTLALGSHADDSDLGPTLDELARLSAVVGATSTLPALNQFRTLEDSPGLSAVEKFAARHDRLVEASILIDNATWDACAIPAFTALYAASGFAECHFEMEIPVGGYTVVDEPGSCRSLDRPTFLPCFSDVDGHLPVDCVSGEIVQANGDRWVEAGPPHPVTIKRPEPDVVETLPVIASTGTTECAKLVALFQNGDPPNGVAPDFRRLSRAARDLDADAQDLVQQFVEANEITPNFTEFEALVTELDEVTAETCGFPIISAWGSITEALGQLPCWIETGMPYPAYEQADCV
jgi:hypothetical protein